MRAARLRQSWSVRDDVVIVTVGAAPTAFAARGLAQDGRLGHG